jgi:formiminotetrahydrofolate cyclodeaminase
MLIDLSIKDFLAQTKSDSPAPGGGSVSALAGSLGAALALMVANLTAASEAAGEKLVGAAVAKVRTDGETLVKMLADFVDEDTAAFNDVMAAFKLPKTTDAEKAARSKAIQEAMKNAAILPLRVAVCCAPVMDLSITMLSFGNNNAASDAAVAGRIAHAGLWGAVYNVRINLGSIKDAAFVADMRERVAKVLEQGDAYLSELTKTADRKIPA